MACCQKACCSTETREKNDQRTAKSLEEEREGQRKVNYILKLRLQIWRVWDKLSIEQGKCGGSSTPIHSSELTNKLFHPLKPNYCFSCENRYMKIA